VIATPESLLREFYKGGSRSARLFNEQIHSLLTFNQVADAEIRQFAVS
jgi:hypothetical protein